MEIFYSKWLLQWYSFITDSCGSGIVLKAQVQSDLISGTLSFKPQGIEKVNFFPNELRPV